MGPTVIQVTQHAPYLVFAGFAAFMILQLFFVIFLMPETKGQSLEAEAAAG